MFGTLIGTKENGNSCRNVNFSLSVLCNKDLYSHTTSLLQYAAQFVKGIYNLLSLLIHKPLPADCHCKYVHCVVE